MAARQPRDAFEPILARVVHRLTQKGEHEISWNEPMLGNRPQRARLQPTALYVFGSFARGAPTCGDLDLILEVRVIEGFLPSTRAARTKLLGAVRRADVLIQTVTARNETERFAEAQLVWSPERPDWQENLRKIEVDTNAGHFTRKTDRLPVPLKQLAIWNIEEAERIVERIDSSELTSEWIPLTEIAPRPEDWSEEQQHAARCVEYDAGKATRKLLPFVLQYTFDRINSDIPLRLTHQRTIFQIGGIHSHLGRPEPNVAALDRIDVSALVLSPHIRAGTGGLWVLTRGPHHPVQRAWSEIGSWTQAVGGVPSIMRSTDGDLPYSPWAGDVAIVARSSRRAIAKTIAEEAGWCDLPVAPLRVAGGELLDLMSRLDLVFAPFTDLKVSGDAIEFSKRLRNALRGGGDPESK